MVFRSTTNKQSHETFFKYSVLQFPAASESITIGAGNCISATFTGPQLFHCCSIIQRLPDTQLFVQGMIKAKQLIAISTAVARTGEEGSRRISSIINS